MFSLEMRVTSGDTTSPSHFRESRAGSRIKTLSRRLGKLDNLLMKERGDSKKELIGRMDCISRMIRNKVNHLHNRNLPLSLGNVTDKYRR